MIKKIHPSKEAVAMNEHKDEFLEPMDDDLSREASENIDAELAEEVGTIFTDDTPAEAEPQQEQPRRRPRAMYFLLLTIFSAVFILSGIYLAHYFVEQSKAASQYDDLNNLIGSIQAAQPSKPSEPTDPTESTSTQTPTDPTGPTEPPATEPPVMLPEYAAIYQLNNDLVGWINIPSIKVKYPVLQTPDRPDYYLRRDFYGNHNTSGCLYVRETCNVFTPSDNVVIYGHAMKTGDMFGRFYYFRDKPYWEKNQYFTFDTLYEHHDYQIFSVFRTSGTWGIGYPYHVFNEAASEEAFNKFIADIKGAAFTMDKSKVNGENLFLGSVYYDTGITPKYGDKILTLSTCEYSIRDPGTNAKNGRLVIMAVRVDCVCDQ